MRFPRPGPGRFFTGAGVGRSKTFKSANRGGRKMPARNNSNPGKITFPRSNELKNDIWRGLDEKEVDGRKRWMCNWYQHVLRVPVRIERRSGS